MTSLDYFISKAFYYHPYSTRTDPVYADGLLWLKYRIEQRYAYDFFSRHLPSDIVGLIIEFTPLPPPQFTKGLEESETHLCLAKFASLDPGPLSRHGESHCNPALERELLIEHLCFAKDILFPPDKLFSTPNFWFYTLVVVLFIHYQVKYRLPIDDFTWEMIGFLIKALPDHATVPYRCYLGDLIALIARIPLRNNSEVNRLNKEGFIRAVDELLKATLAKREREVITCTAGDCTCWSDDDESGTQIAKRVKLIL